MTSLVRHAQPGLALVTVVMSLFLTAQSGLGDTGAPPNIATPTLGGKQVWRDGYVHAGWRIQQNIITGHHRCLCPFEWCKNVVAGVGCREP